MNKIEKLTEKYYEEFVGLPNMYPIVRNGIVEDAYTLVILDIMYSKILNIEVQPENISNISKVIVAPPDSGIDLFIEFDDGDDFSYNIVQSKYSSLSESEIKRCFSEMNRAIDDYLKNPDLVKPNLKNIIAETSFNKSFKKKCTYYVVHKGDLNYGGFKDNEKVITINELETLYTCQEHANDLCDVKVPYDEFKSDAFNNYIIYNSDVNNEEALLCNLRGYDLAKLCNKYANTSMGRNILFGQNLRETIEKKSKTFSEMEYTINNEPERFWYYNNGITIITENLDAQKDINENVDKIKLSNFSIINGAQTTSALGKYLKNAEFNNDYKAIERLKNVYVLARIMEVVDVELRDSIAIYNNTQNPITSRDMVSNRNEQKKLQEEYLNGEKPNIYIEIRRGASIPQYPKFEKHQRTTNEELAQLAFAAFLEQPFNSKDKKNALFNKDNSNEEYLINKYYHELFYYSNKSDEKQGILFEKTRKDIDEALFIKNLYKESRNYLKRKYNAQIDKENKRMKNSSDGRAIENIERAQRMKEINNTCMFYCIALYFKIKEQFGDVNDNRMYDYSSYYRGKTKDYKNNIIKDFADIFLRKTIKIIHDEAGGSVANWIRSSSSQEKFYTSLNDAMFVEAELEDGYIEFIDKYKI